MGHTVITETLREVAARHVGDTQVPGLAALVAHGDDDVHVEALGSLAVGGRPVARDSLFRISSMTKPITAAATLAVIAEGLVGLDEPVERLLPELAQRRVLRRMDGPLEDTVAARRAITTRDLLTFTFGFGMVMDMFMTPTRACSSRWACATQPSGLRRLIAWQPPTGPRPTGWLYGMSRRGRGVDRRLSATAAPAWFQRSMTCTHSQRCCSAAARLCCPARPFAQ